MREKYVVFKREEFHQWFTEWPEVCDDSPEAVQDAVVIRRQDVFAPPALEAYANAIQCVIECLKDESGGFTPTERLQEIADYFHEQAVMAWDTKRKLPD